MIEQVFFYIFAVVAVVSAIAVVTVRNPVHCALYLIVCLLQVAALFILLRAPFLAAVQVFVYVGAVMVLFLFAVMVLDLGKIQVKKYMHEQSVLAVPVVVVVFFMVGYLILKGELTAPLGVYTEAALAKNTEVVGKLLYTKFIFPFEIVSVLLLVALIGAIVLVKREKDEGD